MSKQTLKKAQFMFMFVNYVYNNVNNTRPISNSFQYFFMLVASFYGLYCILHIYMLFQDQPASFMNTQ